MPRLIYNGKKVGDLFDINPFTVIFCYWPEMKNYKTLKKQPDLEQRYKMMHR